MSAHGTPEVFFLYHILEVKRYLKLEEHWRLKIQIRVADRRTSLGFSRNKGFVFAHAAAGLAPALVSMQTKHRNKRNRSPKYTIFWLYIY